MPEVSEMDPLPSPATEHATEEQLDAALVASGHLPSQWQIAAENYVDAGTRFTDDARPSAQIINRMMDMLDEYRTLATNEAERAGRLQSNIDTLNTQLSDQNERVDRLESGMRYLASALRDEAENREWCDEYNEFVDNVNSHLHHDVPHLTKTRQQQRISFECRLTDDEAKELEAKLDRILQDTFKTGNCESYSVELA